MLAEIAFWLLLACVFYIYAGYPLGVLILAPILDRRVLKREITPSVTVVVAAYNEESEIERTVVHLLAQDYPAERLSVFVVSDGSTDRTDEILSRLAERYPGRLQDVRQEPRQGKTQALNLAVSRTSSEIVAFADANSLYAPDAVRALVRNFADPSVGYVTGSMAYTNPAGSGVASGCRAYMRYENALRRIETRVGSIVGVDGGIDAIRRDLYTRMRAEELPDFALPLAVIRKGRRVVFEPDAFVFEPALAKAADEMRMRVRVALRALWTLHDQRLLLNPFRGALYAWQLLSHKAIRYLAFVPLVGLLIASAWAASRHPFYRWLLVAQLACYAWALAGHLMRRSRLLPAMFFAPYYFCVLNVACMLALGKFLMRRRITIWKPRTGEEPEYRTRST